MQMSLTSSNTRSSSEVSQSAIPANFSSVSITLGRYCRAGLWYKNNIEKEERSDFENTLRVVRVSPASAAVNNPDVPEGALSGSPALWSPSSSPIWCQEARNPLWRYPIGVSPGGSQPASNCGGRHWRNCLFWTWGHVGPISSRYPNTRGAEDTWMNGFENCQSQ